MTSLFSHQMAWRPTNDLTHESWFRMGCSLSHSLTILLLFSSSSSTIAHYYFFCVLLFVVRKNRSLNYNLTKIFSFSPPRRRFLSIFVYSAHSFKVFIYEVCLTWSSSLINSAFYCFLNFFYYFKIIKIWDTWNGLLFIEFF